MVHEKLVISPAYRNPRRILGNWNSAISRAPRLRHSNYVAQELTIILNILEHIPSRTAIYMGTTIYDVAIVSKLHINCLISSDIFLNGLYCLVYI
jgi:hypothetical protein